MNKLLEQAHPTTKIPSTALSKTLRPSTTHLPFKAQRLDPDQARISSSTYKHKQSKKSFFPSTIDSRKNQGGTSKNMCTTRYKLENESFMTK